MKDYSEISANQLNDILNSDEWILLDVRTRMERSAGFLPGLHIPLAKIAEQFETIPKEKNLLVYCRCGNRSQTALEILSTLNYAGTLFQLKGGIFGVHKEATKSGTNLLQF